MKKRVLALALVAAMSLSTVASVAPEDKTYLVTIQIPEMAFEYTMGTVGKWNPDTLKYEAPTDAQWTKEPTATITVTNKSDADVKLDCKYEGTDAVGGLSGAITGGDEGGSSKTLKSAVNETDPLTEGTADTVDFTLTITGTPDKAIEKGTKIGTVTLTVSNPA